jgi:hypothetical protein
LGISAFAGASAVGGRAGAPELAAGKAGVASSTTIEGGAFAGRVATVSVLVTTGARRQRVEANCRVEGSAPTTTATINIPRPTT